MSDQSEKARSIFLEAIDQYPPEQWPAHLDKVCAGDAELRGQVEKLLQAQMEIGSFYEPSRGPIEPTIDEAVPEAPGKLIGAYKLLEQIGEGGFGVVFMAEQTAPVRRKVALKILKPGMDTKQVVARFEAERQALAIMDHPNIAKVFDGGATPSGRPYFVMELVKGVPITEFCDEQRLAPRQRLELFVTICQAVQHAHQKGIIHRDLKPSNILVSRHDTTPVVKIIDFGVAKALGQELTDKTMFTGLAQMVGTPLYMSPEQAGMSDLDVDTRSDIYSMGVLLYELLTGSTPFSRDRFKKAAYDEIRRIIREEEPPKPSTRLSEISSPLSPGEATKSSLASVAAMRQTEPAKLTKLVRGELDWIVMKALEKDRNRRYETANGFAMDVQRYLADEHVLACPPSTGYRFRKFARRNKVALSTAAVVAAVLVLGILGTTWQAFRATSAERVAEDALAAEVVAHGEAKEARSAEARERIAAENARQIAEERRQEAEANYAKARLAVDQFLNKVTEDQLLKVPGLQPLRQELLMSALTFYADFVKKRSDDPSLRIELATAHYRIGRIQRELALAKEAKSSNDEAIALFEKLLESGQSSPKVLGSLAHAYFWSGKYSKSVELCKKVLDQQPGDVEIQRLLGSTYNELAIAETKKNPPEIAKALEYHQQALTVRQEVVRLAPDNPVNLLELSGTINNIGVLLAHQNRWQDALVMYERAVEINGKAFAQAPNIPLYGNWLAIGHRNVAMMRSRLGMKDEALKAFVQVVQLRRKLAIENPALPGMRSAVFSAYQDLAFHQRLMGKQAEAQRSYRQAREILENLPRETPEDLYAMAAVYGSLAESPKDDSAKPDAAAQAERADYANQAITALTQAVAAGFTNIKGLKDDPSLASIRDRAEVKKLLTSLEAALEAERLVKQATADPAKLAAGQKQIDAQRRLLELDPASAKQQATLAASLHAIGVVQMGLKQFDQAAKSLHEALAIRKELYVKRPDDAHLGLDVAEVEASLGQLLWNTDRKPQAHRAWQDCLKAMENLAAKKPNDAKFQQTIVLRENEICNNYAQLGLWELASASGLRAMQSPNALNVIEIHFPVLVGFTSSDEKQLSEMRRKRLTYWPQHKAERGFADQHETARMLFENCLHRQSALSAKQMLAIATGGLPAKPENFWHNFNLALAHYRAQEHAAALRIIEQHPGNSHVSPPNSTTIASAFIYALASQGEGKHDLAQRRLQKAEALYRSVCLDLLQPNQETIVSARTSWWDQLAAQILRREAWQLIAGQERPDDPWHRLIQARAYAKIGETQKAEQEFAAAVNVAPDQSDMWHARALVLRQLGHAKRADAEFDNAIKLMPDDAEIWTARGRFYKECGEHIKADADFAKAALLKPDEWHRLIEVGSLPAKPVAAWNFNQGTDGWINQHDCRLTVSDGVLTIESTGIDPQIIWGLNVPAGSNVVKIRAKVDREGTGQLFWRTAGETGFLESASQPFTVKPAKDGWQEYKVYFTASGRLTGLRLDFPEKPGTRWQIDSITLGHAGLEQLDKALQAKGDDARLWIARGRYYARRGEHKKADADFAKAASLTPDELNKFIEAGWWVAGPYPPELREFCPPELEHDPSKPVAAAGGGENLHWRHVPAKELDRVDLSTITGNGKNSAYLMTYIYSPDERTAALRLEYDAAGIRLWLNGQLVHEDAAPGPEVFPPRRGLALWSPRVPLRLRQGRNVLLAKVRGGFALRLGDSPMDRALLFAEQGRWHDAARLVTEKTLLEMQHDWTTATSFAHTVAAVGQVEHFASVCEQILKQHENTKDAGARFWLARACAQLPNRTFDANADRLTKFARECAQERPENWAFYGAALVTYRAGKLADAEQYLEKIPADAYYFANSLPLRALVAFRGGKTDQARDWLAKAQAEYHRVTQPRLQNGLARQLSKDLIGLDEFNGWYDWAQFQTLLREAAEVIEGDSTKIREQMKTLQKRFQDEWEKRDPKVKAFDHVRLLNGVENHRNPLLYISRGHRLAELRRFDDAEADFNKAVELKPDDPQVLGARALFYADKGDSAKSAKDFFSALSLAWANDGIRADMLEAELGRRPEVIDKMMALDPAFPVPLRARGLHFARQGDWKQANDVLTKSAELWKNDAWLLPAYVQALLADDKAYRQACKRLMELPDAKVAGHRKAHAVALRPLGEDQAAALLKLAQKAWDDGPKDRWRGFGLGLALYRNGRYADAAARLEKALEPSSVWQVDAQVWPALAMASWQLGKKEEARKWLARSEWWIDLTTRAAHLPLSVGAHNIDLQEWLMAQTLYREAKALIEDGKKK